MADEIDETDATEAPSFSSPRAQMIWEEFFGDSLSVQEVSEVLGVDKSTVMRWLRDNELAGVRVGRTWRVREADLRAYITDQINAQQEAVRVAALERDVAKRQARLDKTHPEMRYRVLACPKCGRHTLLVKEDTYDSDDPWNTRTYVSGDCMNCSESYYQVKKPEEQPAAPPANTDFENMPF